MDLSMGENKPAGVDLDRYFSVEKLPPDIRLAVIPISRLEEIVADFEALERDNELNSYQKTLLHKYFTLHPPEADFPVRSVVIAVWPVAIARLFFNHEGREANCLIDDGRIHRPTGRRLAELFTVNGHQLAEYRSLPHKRLAVRSGLCLYGRNNVTYAPGWGSFIGIQTYVSDLDPEEHVWRPVSVAKMCESCGKCIANCPTGAILPDRFLINNERCLTFWNDSDETELPAWIPAHAHNTIIGCFRCLEICPMNSHLLKKAVPVSFSEEETRLILAAPDFLSLPAEIREKLPYLATGQAFKCLPRNLALLLGAAI